MDTLPDPKTFRKSLQGLKFYALCPNGKRIEVEKICEEYTKNPQGFVMRTFEDRLVLVIQATVEESIYWQQAFYLSTGESSGMPGTWLPFDGIVLKHSSQDSPSKKQYEAAMSFGATSGFGFGAGSGLGFTMGPAFSSKPSTSTGPMTLSTLSGVKPQKGGSEKEYVTGYFQKELFADQRLERTSNTAFLDSFGQVFGSQTYFPEGDYVYNSDYHFSRFGMLSFALASHALGGNLFTMKAGDFLFAPTFRQNPLDETETYFKDVLNTPSPLQPCFLDMQTNYPITKAYDVNTYIEQNQGFSYMNAFRQEGVFPPGVSAFSVTVKDLEEGKNKIPLYEDELKYSGDIHDLWKDYVLHKKTIEDVKKELPTLVPRLKSDVIYMLATPQKENEKKRLYYGGKSRRRKQKTNPTKKSTKTS